MFRQGCSDDTSRGNVCVRAAILTGGIDKPYVLGLSQALVLKGVEIEVAGNDEMDVPEMHASPLLRFLDLYGDQRSKRSRAGKLVRIVVVYIRLMLYSANARPQIFHVLWNYRFDFWDRTFLMLYYKLLGKSVVMTAHNVNAAERDGKDSSLNRWTLGVQYRLMDHIFVHTEKMKQELIGDFRVKEESISVIPFGVNDTAPKTELSRKDARRLLGLGESEKVILCFGRIKPYKGIEYLVEAFQRIVLSDIGYRLVIAGEPNKESAQYWNKIQRAIGSGVASEKIIQNIRHIPDEKTEIYFKAADVLVLPYTHVFQSGVLFLAYSFGLPVIATSVGSLNEGIKVGETGYICEAQDSADLARTIEKYFASDLYRDLENRRSSIRAFALERNSWSVVGDITRNVYTALLGRGHKIGHRPDNSEATQSS